jgi:Ca2+:H+ antiporter
MDLAVAALDLVLDSERELDRRRSLTHPSDFVLLRIVTARLDKSPPFRQCAACAVWQPVRLAAVTRRLLFGSLVIAPVAIGLGYFADLPETADFVISAIALVPLAWLIGEATEHAAEHTGPRIGGFLNATFGNAPELIIALLAVNANLPEVVRGSLTGSVVSNLLLVLGASLLAGGDGAVDRRSSFVSLALVGFATVLFLVPAIPSWHGDPNRHTLAVTSIPVSVVLLVVYVAVTWRSLRRQRPPEVDGEVLTGWSLRVSLVALALATVATALVAEIMVGSLEVFAHKVGLSDFFVAAVIVAIVGNAAEHGGAVLVAYRGKIPLAAEIALSSAAQVAVFLIPAVALLSWLVKPPLPLSFRPVEIATLAGSAIVVALVLAQGRSSRGRGTVLVAAYGVVVIAYYVAGSR